MTIHFSPRTESRLRTLSGTLLVFFGVLNIFLLYKRALRLEDTIHAPYYPQLAWSFLHHRTDIQGALASDIDLSAYKGKIYLYWPPLTALLMMPIVAIRSWIAFPHRLFGILFGALNASFFVLLAQRIQTLRKTPWPKGVPVIAALIFGLGTSNVTFAIVANHWLIGQITATPFLLLALYFGMDRAPGRQTKSALLSGCALGIATLGRQHLLLAVPLFLFLACSDEHFRFQLLAAFKTRLFLTALPAVLAMAALFAYNRARFGSGFENGMTYHHMDAALRPAFEKYGRFSIFHVPRNLYFNILRPPWWSSIDRQWYAMGFGLFYQSAFLLLAFRRRIARNYPHFTLALWATIGLVSIPILTLFGTGSPQFGSRYLFDVVPFLSVLALLGLDRDNLGMALVLGLLAVALNIMGPLTIVRNYRV